MSACPAKLSQKSLRCVVRMHHYTSPRSRGEKERGAMQCRAVAFSESDRTEDKKSSAAVTAAIPLTVPAPKKTTDPQRGPVAIRSMLFSSTDQKSVGDVNRTECTVNTLGQIIDVCHRVCVDLSGACLAAQTFERFFQRSKLCKCQRLNRSRQ